MRNKVFLRPIPHLFRKTIIIIPLLAVVLSCLLPNRSNALECQSRPEYTSVLFFYYSDNESLWDMLLCDLAFWKWSGYQLTVSSQGINSSSILPKQDRGQLFLEPVKFAYDKIRNTKFTHELIKSEEFAETYKY